MKRIVFIMAMTIMYHGALACDACGCASGSQYIGLLPDYSRNFIGLQQQFSEFSGVFPSAYSGRPDEHVYDRYNTTQLWARHRIGSDYQAFLFLPYQYNIRSTGGERTANAGLGDISLLLNRIVLNRTRNEWKQTVSAGAGLKLPTGQYGNITVADNRVLPNIKPGTGSWDVPLTGNYTLAHRRAGINADASYILTTVNKYSYKYGNRLNGGLAAFYSLAVRKCVIVPSLGARYEYSLHDYDNYNRKWLNEDSGGSFVFGTAGVQAYFKHYGARINWQLPVSQHFGGGAVKVLQKVETSIFFLF